MENKYTPFPNAGKIKQFIVQFAFRIPTRKELSSGEKKALENTLRELDSGTFQLFEDPSKKMPGSIFHALQQIPVGAATVTMPSFVFSHNSFSFIFPVFMAGNYFSDFDSFDTTSKNKDITGWVVKIQDVVGNLNCHRTGKIFEIVLGPFTSDEKSKVFKNLFSVDLVNIGEVNLSFAHYVDEDSFVYNIQTNVNYMQQKLDSPFDIRIRVDINNRELKKSLEPGIMNKVWSYADKTLNTHLQEIFDVS